MVWQAKGMPRSMTELQVRYHRAVRVEKDASFAPFSPLPPLPRFPYIYLADLVSLELAERRGAVWPILTPPIECPYWM